MLFLLDQSHLQPPSYGPVLSPMSKAHGAVNKLPSVKLAGGPASPHGSAAGPTWDPWVSGLGQGVAGGRVGEPAQTLCPAQDRSGLLLAGPPAVLVREQEARSPVHSRSWGGLSLRASPTQPGTPALACPSDCPTCFRPRPRDTQQPQPHPAGQRGDEWWPQLPVHGLGVPLYPVTPYHMLTPAWSGTWAAAGCCHKPSNLSPGGLAAWPQARGRGLCLLPLAAGAVPAPLSGADRGGGV